MNTTFKRTLFAAVATLAVCWSHAQGVSTMRGADVSEADAAPSAKAYLGSKPGAQSVIARTFDKQPPLIPHKVEGFDDITPTDNSCLDCHINDKFRGQKIPRMGTSHFLPNTDPKAPAQVSMSRWQCNNCHVPQVDAPALVENQFKGTPPASTAAASAKKK